LNEKCRVIDMDETGLIQEVLIECTEDVSNPIYNLFTMGIFLRVRGS